MIRSKVESEYIEIDLTGPGGNGYSLLAQAQNLARELKLDNEAIQTEMASGDYENLVETFDKYFGKYVVLYR